MVEGSSMVVDTIVLNPIDFVAIELVRSESGGYLDGQLRGDVSARL